MSTTPSSFISFDWGTMNFTLRSLIPPCTCSLVSSTLISPTTSKSHFSFIVSFSKAFGFPSSSSEHLTAHFWWIAQFYAFGLSLHFGVIFCLCLHVFVSNHPVSQQTQCHICKRLSLCRIVRMNQKHSSNKNCDKTVFMTTYCLISITYIFLILLEAWDSFNATKHNQDGSLISILKNIRLSTAYKITKILFLRTGIL